MTNKQVLFFFIALSSYNVFSQNGIRHGEFMVIAQSGINIRSEPKLTSDIVIGVPFGSMIKRSDANKNVVADTIDNLPGHWVHVEYLNKSGFAFNSNLSQSIQDYNTQFKKGLPQFIYEGTLDCGDFIFFNSDLKWYGVYPDRTTKYRIKRITPIIEPYFNSYDGYVAQRIQTSDTVKSEFLFGLPNEISDTTIYRTKIPIINYGNHENRFLLPGMSVGVGYDNNTNIAYSIDVLGGVDSSAFINHSNSNARPVIKNYQLRLTGYGDDKYLHQNLNKEVDTGMGHDFIEILFAGDLNSDGKPDFIVRTRQTNVSELLMHFLMSGQSKEKIVDRVAENYWGGCY